MSIKRKTPCSSCAFDLDKKLMIKTNQLCLFFLLSVCCQGYINQCYVPHLNEKIILAPVTIMKVSRCQWIKRAVLHPHPIINYIMAAQQCIFVIAPSISLYVLLLHYIFFSCFVCGINKLTKKKKHYKGNYCFQKHLFTDTF